MTLVASQVRALSPYEYNNNNLNRVSGPFGSINLKGTRNEALRALDLRYCLVNSSSDEPITLRSFEISFFDFDQLNDEDGQECLAISGFESYTVSKTTELTIVILRAM